MDWYLVTVDRLGVELRLLLAELAAVAGGLVARHAEGLHAIQAAEVGQKKRLVQSD
jgi:hypothetical protein